MTTEERKQQSDEKILCRKKMLHRRFLIGGLCLLLLTGVIIWILECRDKAAEAAARETEVTMETETEVTETEPITEVVETEPPTETETETESVEERIQAIIDQPDIYPEKYIEMIQKNPEALDFVESYPREHNLFHEIDLKDEYTPGEIPHFLQWDKRWGYESYGNGIMGMAGCGPTCLSMVYVGLTGDVTMHPKKVADFSVENGYITENASTMWTLMTTGAQELGLEAWVVPFGEQSIRDVLESGSPVICSVRPGDFTDGGHFIVLTGVNADGTINVNDPNSYIRTEQTWELPHLMSQMKNVWAFRAPEPPETESETEDETESEIETEEKS